MRLEVSWAAVIEGVEEGVPTAGCRQVRMDVAARRMEARAAVETGMGVEAVAVAARAREAVAMAEVGGVTEDLGSAMAEAVASRTLLPTPPHRD